VLLKRDWYLDQLDQAGTEPLEFVSSFNTNSGVSDVARDISERVGIGERLRKEAGSWDEYLRLIVAGAEEAGVLVMRSGIVGSNTRRSLSVNEFRGFALVNPFAPLVFINAKDSKAAQIFTFAHELAHIWIGQEGVSNPDLYRRTPPSQIEQICNAIAAEILVPADEFKSRWNAKRGTTLEKSEELARSFRVSGPVILRRAKDSDFISLNELFELLRRHEEKVEALEKKKEEEESGGGNFYNNLWARNGIKLTSALLNAARSQAINSLEAARLLNVKASTLPKLIERMAT
jgi:Zn-dependent peptidase ImmA (M78 family)